MNTDTPQLCKQDWYIVVDFENNTTTANSEDEQSE